MYGYLRHMAQFARIVEAGSMRAASELIGVAPSGLSDSVRILETRLKAPLLVRHKAGVTPTSEGERVYAAASAIIDFYDQIMGDGMSSNLAGPCRISVPTEVANTCVGAVINHLNDSHPNLQVSIFAEDELVDHGRFGRDYFLRFSARPEQPAGLRSIWSGEANAILVGSSALVIDQQRDDPDFICKLPVILGVRRKKPFSYPLTNPDGQIEFSEALLASQPSSRLALAVQGHGVTGCIDCCASEFLADGKLVHILSDRFRVPLKVNLLTPHQRRRDLDEPVVEAVQSAMIG